ncbi:RrF2 family transcriptional regulator [Paenibacillus sp. y28]|uniref:RrF2 family transcriptional regulator n=1 Tax=Paenibacillus sp. y28 TaxID=3129110 RepID=UPI00301A2258
MSMEKNQVAATPRWFGFALQSLVFLANSTCPESRCPSGEIADHVCSEATLMRRILARLARAGIVEAREGRDGGYYLSKAPETITFADVYRAVQMTEPLFSGMLETTSEGPLSAEFNLAFQELADEAEAHLLQLLEKRTIADLCDIVYSAAEARKEDPAN